MTVHPDGPTFLGNADVVRLLSRAARTGRLSHAYLITGARGVGRRTLALWLAQLVNCLAEPADRPCGACRVCRQISRGVHPDVRVVRRNPDNRWITLRQRGAAPKADRGGYVDNVEFIQSDAQLRPHDARQKVYLILNAEELGQDAANRLLKVIEEPTPYVRFLLTAADRGVVLPTIASRCQEIRLQPVAAAEIARALVARHLADPERAAVLAGLAGGRPGWALTAAREPAVYESHLDDVRVLRVALQARVLDRMVTARALSERWSVRPEEVRTTLRAWRLWLRDVVLIQNGASDRTAHASDAEREHLAEAARLLARTDTWHALSRVQRTLVDLEANVNARLTIDLLLLDLPHVSSPR